MTIAYGVAAMLAGVLLVFYCLDTATDPFWSRHARAAGAVGTLIGLGSIVLGLLTVAPT